MYDEKSASDSSELKYREGDILAVSINPDDKLQCYLNKDRYNSFREYYSKKFDRLDNPTMYDYWFRIELSEPIGTVTGEGPRLHLHGIVILKTKMAVFNWLYLVMPDLLQHARMEIHHCQPEGIEGWIRYCNKQKDYIPKSGYLSNHDSPDGEEILISLRTVEMANLSSPAGAGERKGGEVRKSNNGILK